MPVDSWKMTVLRAVPAAVVALVITFSADHSAFLGFMALGGFGIVSGAVIAVGTMRGAYPRLPFLVQGAVLVIGGVVALALSDSGLPALLVLTSALFATTGVIELVTGLRSRRHHLAARDWIFVGGFTTVFAAAVLLLPVDFVDVISIPGKDVPPLTASIMLVGLLGAYAAIVAVYLVIAGLSLKWAPQASATVTEA